MKKITLERIEELFGDGRVDSEYEGDNFLQGIEILKKYFDISKEDIVRCASHDTIWTPDAEELIERGLTEEDAIKLVKLNWVYDEDDEGGFCCFV